MKRRLLYGILGIVVAGTAVVIVGFLARYELFRLVLELPPYSHSGGAVHRQHVTMSDGVRLQTQVYLPAGEGPFPTVLIRDPYNYADIFGFLCGVFARYGYACVHQDVRGRMGSEGEWAPLANERRDGIDTLAWLTAQPFQDGHIAMWGMSYLAAVQWSVADVLPPEVKTLVPMVSGTDSYRVSYSGGMFRPEIFTAWAALMPDHSMRLDHGDEYWAALRHRPALEVDERFFGRKLEWYRLWIASPNRTDPAWQRQEVLAFRRMPEQTHVPVLMLGGWYDFFLPSQLEDFRALASREQSRLVVGPWNHIQQSLETFPGDIGMGGQWRQVLNWLDHHLRGGPLEGPTGVIQTYVYGEGRWQTRRVFPPPDTSTRAFTLSDLAASPTCAGGRLDAARTTTATTAISNETGVSYRYDPDDPVPSRGGANMLAFAFQTYRATQPGPRTINGVCERTDVLTFISAPLAEPLRLVGPTVVELLVSSSAPDTAFTAKLIEVGPDGTARHVRDGIRSLAYRDGEGEGPPRRYAPKTTVDLRIELSPIEWTFPVHSRIRLDVSSSNFPVYHAHSNRYGPWASHTGSDVATNTVHGGRLALTEAPPANSPTAH